MNEPAPRGVDSTSGGARRDDDPILTSIIANRLRSIGERMGVVVERSARSPLLVEGRDFSVGIYGVDGTLVEQTEYIPVLGYATTPGMRAIAERWGKKPICHVHVLVV